MNSRLSIKYLQGSTIMICLPTLNPFYYDAYLEYGFLRIYDRVQFRVFNLSFKLITGLWGGLGLGPKDRLSMWHSTSLVFGCFLYPGILSDHNRKNENWCYLKVRTYLTAEALSTGKLLMFGSTSKSLVMWFRQNSLKSTSCKKETRKSFKFYVSNDY